MSASYNEGIEEIKKVKGKKSDGRLVNILAPVILLVAIFGLWELLVVALKIPIWALDKPTGIFTALFTKFGSILPDALVSLQTLTIGFMIGITVGVILGGILSNFPIVDKAISPFVIFLVCTPLMTLVPLMMIWLGFGLTPKIIAVTLQTFPIVMMNTATGFANVDIERKELMLSMKASRLTTFFRVLVPSALPNIFTGIKLGCIFATTTTIAVEFVGGNSGLGSQIIKHTQYMRTGLAFACIFTVAIISIAFYGVVSLAEKYAVRWKE
jgi:NitT/TauT family transport system permease protein